MFYTEYKKKYKVLKSMYMKGVLEISSLNVFCGKIGNYRGVKLRVG
jgi:hypothetical protein